MARNLTQGGILKNIAVFSVPFFISYFLQTLYGLADLLIVGQFEGAEAITAVAIGSQAMHFLTVIVVGLAMGTTVLIGRATGAKNFRTVSRIAGNTVTLFGIFSLLLTGILLFFCKDIASVLKTPEEAFSGTMLYLRICFAGIPFIVAYNVIAAVFRGMGDSRRPMYFIAVACVLNIALDYIFIGCFRLGAQGAALATVISQAASVVISLLAAKRSHFGVRISPRDLKPNKFIFRGILGIGTPVAAQDGFIQVSFLLITVIANGRGLEIAAAVGIVEKIIGFLFLVPSSMLSTISVVAAQNIGAGETLRAKKTLWVGTTVSASIGAVFAASFQFLATPTLKLFTDDPAVILYGTEYLRAYVLDCFFAAGHFCFSGYFCACGLSIVSFVHNALSIIIFRIPGTWLAAKYFPDTLTPMGLAAPLGSLFSVAVCITVYATLGKRLSTKENAHRKWRATTSTRGM